MAALLNSILTEEDNYNGIDIRNELPNDGDYVKMKMKPSDDGAVKEFAYGKVSKIAKGRVGQVIVDEDEYLLSFELTIRQYFMENGNVIYDKWNFKQPIILSDIINWRRITDADYRFVNDAYENTSEDGPIQPQPEPVLEQNPITDVSIQGGRRKTRRNRRKTRRNRRKTKRSRR
jgi:hypothetical protein